MQKKRSCSDNVGPHYLQIYAIKHSSSCMYTYRTVYWAPLNGHFLVEVLLAGHQNCLKGHTETLVEVFNLHTYL